MGKGGCTAAGRAARSKAQGQPDLSEGCVRRDDAYKVPQAHFYVEIADRAPPHRGRGQGVRSRAPPVADAARRSTRSGRKNRASEQREDFFGHRKAARTAIGQGVHRRKSRCRDQNLNKQLFAQTAPPPLRGRGTGRGQMRLRLPWERICAQYGRCFSIVRIQHCKRRKGVCQGGICPP